MFQTVSESILIGVPIESKIRSSNLPEGEKVQFLNLLSYFTPRELIELEGIL